MWHLRNQLKNFPKQLKVNNSVFYLNENISPDIKSIITDYLSGKTSNAIEIIETEPEREIVLLTADNKLILKKNTLNHWKSSLRNTLGIKKVYGYKDLTNEFVNLMKIKKSIQKVPIVYGFGFSKKNALLINEEFLLIEYFENTKTIDEMFIQNTHRFEDLLSVVFSTFKDMINAAIIHLDPHPKNILVTEDLSHNWLIDFEYCACEVFNSDITLGFLTGYFYFYWINRYIDYDEYDNFTFSQINSLGVNDQKTFKAVYYLFKNNPIKRKTRYLAFTDKKENARILALALSKYG